MDIELKNIYVKNWESIKYGDFILCSCCYCGKPIRRAKGRFKNNPFESPPLCHSCANKKASKDKYGEYIRLDNLEEAIDVSSFGDKEYDSFFKKVYITQKYKYICTKCGKEVFTKKNMYHDREVAPLRLCPSCKRKETSIKIYGEYAPSKIGKAKRIANGWKPKYYKEILMDTLTEEEFNILPSTQRIKSICFNCGEYFIKEKRMYGRYNPIQQGYSLCKKCSNKRFNIISYFQLKDREILESFILLTPLKEFINLGAQAYVDVKCSKCGNQFKFHYYCGYSPNCSICNPPNRSLGETEVYNFIKENYSGTIIRNDRDILKGREIDILIPDLKLAIEYDGLYWHTDDMGKNENYHRQKQKDVESFGYRMIFIREDEWFEKKDICKNIISSLLNTKKRKRVFARKCEVRELTNNEASLFLQENHIQGSGGLGRVKIGLFFDGLLISVVTFGKPRFNNNYEYEIIRYAVLGDIIIIGGFAKMLKYFKRVYNPSSIITYADNRYFSGDVYRRNDFIYEGETEANYKYLKGHKTHNRMEFQKHKLNNILENFDEGKTEKENMKENGYSIIYDCGNKRFTWNKEI